MTNEIKILYETKVKPLIEKKDYGEALFLLTNQPELKDYLTHSELRDIHYFVEELPCKMLCEELGFPYKPHKQEGAKE